MSRDGEGGEHLTVMAGLVPAIPRLSPRSAGLTGMPATSADAEAASMNLRLGNSRLALQKIKIATFVGLPDMG
jgi:hypothetical protein